MKLKNTNKLALWALALTATLAVSQAAPITVASSPYTYSTPGLTNADTIQANAGGAILNIASGSGLIGNGASSSALNINAAGYVVNNSGILVGNGATGVNVGATTTLNNAIYARMSSGAAQPGISVTAGTLTVVNGGIIEGADDGLRSATNSLSVTNQTTGKITGIPLTGTAGASSDGIQTLDGLLLNNYGAVIGNAFGINAGAGLALPYNITNNAGATITGVTRGVSATSAFIVINNGTISATGAGGNGIQQTTGAVITNNLGATINGLVDAVQVTTGAIIANAGTIASTGVLGTVGSDGIQLTDGTIVNTGTYSGTGTITGGIITGADRGIRYASTLASTTVTNSGAISGVVAIDYSAGTTADTLTMTAGTIGVIGTGTQAVLFGPGNDVLNLQGGTITGIVDGGTGIDTINFNGGAATITGNVTNFETIVRSGTGVATITGTTMADQITINSGGLYLNGNVSPSTIGNTTLFLNGGVLGGTSVWNGVVTQTGGMLSPGTAPLVVGSLTLGSDALGTKLIVSGGSLLVNMNAATQASDLLTVSANANISGGATVLVSPTSVDAPLQSTSTRVVNVAGIRTGNYAAAGIYLGAGRTDAGPLVPVSADGAFTSSTVSLSVAGGNVALLQNINDIYVTVAHNYDTVAGLTSFGQQFGTFLNGQVAASLTNPILADFLGYLDYSDATTVAGVMNAYQPTDFQASLAYSVVSAREIHRIVEQQNLGDRLFPSSNHVWANYNYNDYSNTGSTSRYTMGIGSAVDTLHFGALLSYANSDITDTSKVESLAYGAYMGMGASTGWQINGYFGGSHNKTTTNRGIPTFANSPLFSAINFNPDGDSLQALLSSAYLMEAGTCTWGPTFGLEYADAKLKGNIQPGANLPGMSYSSDTLKSLRSLLGVRAECTLGSKVRPYASAQWAHEFEGDSNGYAATFQGASFQVNSPIHLAADSIIMRAGLVISLCDACFGDIGYLGEYSTSGDSADYNGLNIGLHASF